MITATMSEKSIRVEGHAERQPGAKDNLVCAAVSALVQTARDSLEVIAGAKLMNYEEKSGLVSFDFAEKPNRDGVVIIRALRLGLSRLADSYPGVIRIYAT